MIQHIIDTDTFTLLGRGSTAIRNRLAGLEPSAVALSMISVEEQITGRLTYIRKAKDRESVLLSYEYLTRTTETLKMLPIVTFTSGAYEQFERLKALKLNFDANNDLRIAVISLDLGATVVTRNVRDFNRVPGLVVENWADSTGP